MISEDCSSVQCNDLSTQTDFSPRLSNGTFQKLNKIRLDSSDLNTLGSILRAKNDESRLSQESMMIGLKTKKRNLKSQFQELIDCNQFKLDSQNHISSNPTNPDVIDLAETIASLRRNDSLPGRASIEELVNSTAVSSTMGYCESSTESHKVNFRHCFSQTEISTLLIGVNFEDILPTDGIQQTVSKLNSSWIRNTDCMSKLTSEIRRLQRYCDDLSDGKQITAFEIDLSFEDEDARFYRYESLIKQIHNQANRIVDHHMHFQANTADASYATNLKLDLPFVAEMSENDYARLQKALIKLKGITKKFENHEKDMEKLKKVKSEPEYKRIETLFNEKRAEVHRLESQLRETNHALTEIKRANITMQNKVSNLRRLNDDRLKNEAKKFSKKEVKQLKTKISQLEILVQKYQKYKWYGTEEKSCSENEMILREKDNLIAEYLSVLDRNRIIKNYL